MVRKYAQIFDREHNLYQEANIFLEVKLKLTNKTKGKIVKNKIQIVKIRDDCDERQTTNLSGYVTV